MTDPNLPAVERPSDRSRAVAVALCFTLGIFGAHRYYAGKIGTGILMTCTFGGLGIGWLVDAILVSTGEFRDRNGRRITQWAPNEMPPPGMVSIEQVDALREEIAHLRDELMDVHERIDFQERMLQRGRQ